MHKELKENRDRQLTSMKMMHEQNENIKKLLERIKHILELESIITELKNSLEGFNSRLDRQKKIVNELEGRLFEIIETEEQKENKMKKIEESLRDYGISLSGPYMHYGSLKRERSRELI